MTGTERVARLNAAKAERAAVIEWETNGKQGDRPATPINDEIAAAYSAQGPAKGRKTREPKGRTESPLDVAAKETLGTLPHPPTVAELAAAIDAPTSSTQHVVNRLVSTGFAEIVNDSPKRIWVTGEKAPALPVKAESATRTRKVHAVKGKSGKVAHAAHARRGENGTEYHALCLDAPIVDPTKVGDEDAVTCKRCLKVAQA